MSAFGREPILAFNDPWHDSSFFFCEGQQIVHVESERLSRRKYEYLNPMVIFCEAYESRIEDFHDIILSLNGENTEFMLALIDRKWNALNKGSEPPTVPLADPLLLTDRERASDRNQTPAVRGFARHLMRKDVRIHLAGHHACHAANAFYSSDFDNALVVSLDGGGMDFATAANGRNIVGEAEIVRSAPSTGRVHIYGSVYECAANQCRLVHQFSNFSLGKMWTRVITGLLHLREGDEGTAMAMAALGDPLRFRQQLDAQCISFPEDYGLSDGQRAELASWVADLRKSLHTEQDLFDVAAALQATTEDRTRHILGEFIRPDHRRVCLVGGVFLNCQVTGKISEWFPQIESLYIPPAPYDGGLSIGAAQLLHHEHFAHTERLAPNGIAPYSIGPSYSRLEVVAAARVAGVALRPVASGEVVRLVAAGKLIGLFQGAAESGRRALGNRSIVAHPGIKGMKQRLNETVKHRQWFRPFAPMVLAEHVGAWFECGRDFQSPYMSFAVPVRAELRSHVENIVHYDGTARLQTVHRDLSPTLHRFLAEWHGVTGLPMLLNTSFNDREPIVETPLDALRTFDRTPIDHVYFADHGLLASKCAG